MLNFTVSGIRWRRIANAKSQTAPHTYTLTLATAWDMYSITTHRNCAARVPRKNAWLIGIVNTMKCRRIVNMKSTTLRYTDNYTDMRHITVHWQLRRICTTTTIHVIFTVSGITWRRIANAKSQTAWHTYTQTLATARDMYSITIHRNCAGRVPRKIHG